MTRRANRRGHVAVMACLVLSAAGYLASLALIGLAWLASPRQGEPKASDVAPQSPRRREARPEVNQGGAVAVARPDYCGGIRTR